MVSTAALMRSPSRGSSGLPLRRPGMRTSRLIKLMSDHPGWGKKRKRVKPGGSAGTDTEAAPAHLTYRHLRRPILIKIDRGEPLDCG